MKNMSPARFISIGGLLTTMAVIFQSAPVFLPVIGLGFSPLSTLPVAIAAFLHIPLGITVYFAAALILAFIYIQEAIILFFTTGLLGIVIGTFLFRRGIVVSIILSGVILTLGMLSLTYIAGIAAFGDLTSSLSIPLTIVTFLSFALVYASIWNICLRKLINYLIKIKAFGNIVS
ncbi:hypothetical protein MM300_12990 [Evansella sp. LMS18]|uniref:hypothetical protein n=1 Tax=Evansella sp. LMS18 TaxID=2924033 RepID=UPI0020D00284|nr:hypothetical protein [Evansella sp. LMS18]UTR08853.1 hypothetical protein MM300_12990 [Evansella sp. LMS18]